jgi:hypothetical protein
LELLGSLRDNERPASIFVGDFNDDGELDALVWVYDDQVGSLHHNVYEFLGNVSFPNLTSYLKILVGWRHTYQHAYG